MFKRMFLAFTFVAAVSAGCVGMASNAEAHGYGRGGGGYGGGYAAYYGYRNYYGGYPPVYPSYYGAGYTYAAPVVIYPGGGRRHRYHDGYHNHRRYRDRGGVTFSFGF